jgi:hypothetical protein
MKEANLMRIEYEAKVLDIDPVSISKIEVQKNQFI